MASKKISQLPASAGVTSATLLPTVTSGTTEKATVAQLETRIQTDIAPEVLANKDTDGTLAANSDTKYASQKAAKAYTDAHALGAFFGRGLDGTVNLDGINTFGFASLAGSTYTLTRSIFGDVVTVANGVTVKTAGFRIIGKTSVTNNGTIQCDGTVGGNAAGATAGTGGAGIAASSDDGAGSGAGSIRSAGGNGATGVNGAGAQGTTPSSGSGWGSQNSGGGGAGGAGTNGGGAASSAQTVTQLFNMISVMLPHTTQGGGSCGSGGSSGGGSGSAAGGGGGGGGGGAGVLEIYSPSIVNNGTISANGGNGGNGGNGVGANCGGGGGGSGGGGGVVLLVYKTITLGTVTANGGTKGTKGTGGAGAANGSDGTNGQNGLVTQFNILTGAWT